MLYILKSTLILGILLGVYHLFLEKEKMHQFNRFYLLSGLVLAFATPLITVGTVDPVATTSFIASAPMIITEVQSDIIYETEKGIDWLMFIIYGYGLITLIMLLRYINNIATLLLKVRNNQIIIHRGHKIVLLEEATLPHTFLNYVFINQTDFEAGDIEEELFIHEFAHSDQLHSLDILLIELIHVFNWFNPLILLYKRAIQLNHEFLADKDVLQSIDEVPSYQNLLLDKASNTNQVYLASNLNFGVTKKRLLMMTKPISKRRNLIYRLMIIPVIIGLVSCFGDYDNIIPQSGSIIEYIDDDRFSVNLMALNKEQLDEAQIALSKEGIDLKYLEVDFGNDGKLQNTFEFSVNFNNGSSSRNSISCPDKSNISYGVGMNRTTGQSKTGFLGAEYNKSKFGFFDKMTKQRNHGAKYFLDGKSVSYEEAVEWYNRADKWQTGVTCDDPNTGLFTFSLTSSLDQSWNPFKKDKSPKELLNEMQSLTTNENDLKAKFYGDATIVFDNNGNQKVYDNFNALSPKDKASIPGPWASDVSPSGEVVPLGAKVVLYNVAEESIYTNRFIQDKEIPLITDSPNLKNPAVSSPPTGLAVNFTGMNKKQLNAMKAKLSQDGIDVIYNELEFNSDGSLNIIDFSVSFPNGNSGSASINFSKAGRQLYGFYWNEKTGEISVGTLKNKID